LLAPTLPLSKAIANILVFINAHLAFNHANQVAVVASHSRQAQWLYPRQPSSKSADGDVEMQDDTSSNLNNPNKYRPFALVERDVLASLRSLISSTTAAHLTATTTTQIAGALTLALSYINKATVSYASTGAASTGTTTTATGDVVPTTAGGLQSRILVISVSGDLAHQYIPIMNSTFAAQRLRIPIDILKLAGDTVFLQQASDATKGIYLHLRSPQGLLQYLMQAFLPAQSSRAYLVEPTMEVVDFRAACFCHRKVVDVGFVCSICLSIFCAPPEDANCLTCGTHLALGDYGGKPAVVPRKKKKRKRVINGVETGSARGTPAPGE
jgi:transcription initiation factor TFIIH subunit 3